MKPQRLYALGILAGFVAATALIFKLLFWVLDLREARGKDSLTIGSKAFTESIVLAELIAELLRRQTELDVVTKTDLGGTHICFQALVSGEIDLYPEYTGTGLMAILKRPKVNGAERAFEIVQAEFSKQFELVWLAPMAFNNTYALAMSAARAEALGIRVIGDLRRHPGLRAGFTSEFMARSDGYPGLKKHYSLSFDREPASMEAGLMYGAAAKGEVDVISAYATDGRLDKLDLRVLDDDREFFPPYQAAPLIRRNALERHPEIRTALEVLRGQLTDAEMRAINLEVDQKQLSAREAARKLAKRLLAPQN